MPHSSARFDGVHHGRRLQQRLRGDAPAEQARAAEPVVALDEGDALAELGGAQGGGVPTRPGSDHDYVVRITHPMSKSTRVPRIVRRRLVDAPPYDAADGRARRRHRS